MLQQVHAEILALRARRDEELAKNFRHQRPEDLRESGEFLLSLPARVVEFKRRVREIDIFMVRRGSLLKKRLNLGCKAYW